MNPDTWPWALQLAVAIPLVAGGLFALLGAIGLWRFDDVYSRLHLPTLAATLGLGGILLGTGVLSWARGGAPWGALLIGLLVFVTAPVSALMMAQAARHRREPSRAPAPPPAGTAEDA
jgi:multicomponent K+:H+ antiporter subunit G